METKPELSSIMQQVESLQKQLAQQASELKDTREREDAARRQLTELSAANDKLTEAKREAMKQDFNNLVQGWVRSLDSKQVPDLLKDEFLSGVEKFVDKGNESGIWKVVCCASTIHQHQVNTIQKLTDDYNALRKTVDGGDFKSEESRKRKEPEESTVPAVPHVWAELEGMCRNY